MDKKLLFNDALSSLIEFAAANANHVSTEDIHTFFNDIIEDEKQYEFIYKYLQESKIKIEGLDCANCALELEEEISDNVILEYVKVVDEKRTGLEIERLKKLMLEKKDPLEQAKIAEKIRKLKMGSWIYCGKGNKNTWRKRTNIIKKR